MKTDLAKLVLLAAIAVAFLSIPAFSQDDAAAAQNESAVSQDEQEPSIADQNAALFLEALRIQGYIAAEVGGKDITAGNEAFSERSTRLPDAAAGDWYFYTPAGDGYYWTASGRISTINNYRLAAGAGLPVGKISAYVREHGHFSTADYFSGYQLVETDHLWTGAQALEIAGTGLSASYYNHDANRGLAVPQLPEYDADHFRLWYQSGYNDGIEWRADYFYDTFTSAPILFDNAKTKGFRLRGDYRFDEFWRVRADYGTRWQDAATGVESNYSGDDIHFGVRYGAGPSPWFGGADVNALRNRGVPALNTHLDESRKYSVYFGWKSDSFVQKVQVGYEAGDLDLTRLKLEDPGFQQIKTNPGLKSADLTPFWQAENPDYDRWYFDGLFAFGDARLSAKYWTQSASGTATRQLPTGAPVQPILPESQQFFRAQLWIPFTDRLNIGAGEWYRKSESLGNAASYSENIMSADLSLGIFDNHTISAGVERSEWETGLLAGAANPFGDVTQDTWQVGWASDFDSFDASLSFAQTDTSSSVAGVFDADYSTLASELKFKFGKFPITLGAEIFDSNFDFAPNFDYEGFRIFLRTVWEF